MWKLFLGAISVTEGKGNFNSGEFLAWNQPLFDETETTDRVENRKYIERALKSRDRTLEGATNQNVAFFEIIQSESRFSKNAAF